MEILKSNDIKKTTAYDAARLISAAIPAVQNLYYNNVLHKRSVLLLASLKKDVQKYIIKNYLNQLDNGIIKSIPKDATCDMIDQIFKSNEDEEKLIIKNKRFIIKASEEEKFKRWLKTWDTFEKEK